MSKGKQTKDVQPKEVEKPVAPKDLAAEDGTFHERVFPEQHQAEEPAPRFHGDPHHAQFLLADPERKNEGINYVAEHAWRRFSDTFEGDLSDGKGIDRFDRLNVMFQGSVLANVSAIINDPHAKPYASTMPRNHDRKAFRALDDAIRDTLGYARVQHED